METRRNKLWLLIPAELAIFNAVQEVEKMPADERLTDAVRKLQEARDHVADYVEGVAVRTPNKKKDVDYSNMRSFETEFQLQEWRKIESQHFDSNGFTYAGQSMSGGVQEQMLKLINQLDSELTIMEQPLEKEVLEQMRKMCIESLPPHDFDNWCRIEDALRSVRKNLR